MSFLIIVLAIAFSVPLFLINKRSVKIATSFAQKPAVLSFFTGLRKSLGDNGISLLYMGVGLCLIGIWVAVAWLPYYFAFTIPSNYEYGSNDYESIQTSVTLINGLAIILSLYSFFRGIKAMNTISEITMKAWEPSKEKSTVFGSADFEQLPDEYVNGAKESDRNLVWFGVIGFLASNHKKHLISIAPSRSGKGACLIMPNLLSNFSNSYVVLDIKGENAAVSARYQQNIGKDVVIIDPWGVQEKIGAVHGIKSMSFNPLTPLDGLSDEQLFEECSSIAELIAPMPKNTKDPFWITRARVLIRGLLLAHIKIEMPANWSLMAVYKALRLGNAELIAYLNSYYADIELAADDLNQFKDYKSDDKTFLSILSTAQDTTEFIRNISKSGGETFNPKQLNEKTTIVYICIPEKAVESNYQWLRLIIGQSIRSISENVKNKKVERTVFLLDEAHYLGDMPEVRKALATSATYGICIWQFYQDIGQVQAAYGDYWHSIMNVGVQQFYKVSDLNTQKYVSELLGDKTIEVNNSTVNSKGETSTSTNKSGVRLMTPDEVGKCDKLITRIDSRNYLLFAVPYFDKNLFNFNYDKNPLV